MAKKLVGGLVFTLFAVSLGAGYRQSDVQLLQIIAGTNASSSTGSKGGPPTLIAGVNIVAKPGSTLNECLSEGNAMQGTMQRTTSDTLKTNYHTMVFVHSSEASTVIVGGTPVAYVYITIWLISGATSVPADATAQSLLLDAYTGLVGWSKCTPASVQLGSTITAATSASAQFSKQQLSSLVGDEAKRQLGARIQHHTELHIGGAEAAATKKIGESQQAPSVPCGGVKATKAPEAQAKKAPQRKHGLMR